MNTKYNSPPLGEGTHLKTPSICMEPSHTLCLPIFHAVMLYRTRANLSLHILHPHVSFTSRLLHFGAMMT